MARISVLVVDDSAFMRRALAGMLEREPDIAVTTARSGEEAVAKAESLQPDVITMDVEMPGIGGLEAVRRIVAQRRVPIVMVSALTYGGAETTFRALELGATDFIAKPDAAYANIHDVARDLVAKIRALAPVSTTRAESPARNATHAIAPMRRGAGDVRCVAIGTSTGGPVALSRLLPMLPRAFPVPLLIVQHMPIGFTGPLARRLNEQCAIDVAEGTDGMRLSAGCATIVRSGRECELARKGDDVVLHLGDSDGSSLHVPSVDALMTQAANVYGAAVVGVILTGMGQDGVKGLRALKASGGYVVGQDEASCVVYGMPRAAERAGLVDRVLPLDDIAAALCTLTRCTQ